jgi:hypothetical protein
MKDFPHFLTEGEVAYKDEYAKMIIEGQWIFHRWREDIKAKGKTHNRGFIYRKRQ